MTTVAILGGGISGLIYAHVLRKNGLTPVVFEKHTRIGGVWARAYPDVRLQNVEFQYRLSDVPWTTPPDLHPTGEQIRAYWAHVASTLDVRLDHDVLRAEEKDGAWIVTTKCGEETVEHRFDRLVVATGQYTDQKHRPRWPGEESFRGTIGTERDVRDFASLAGEKIVVVGFGKSALDVATLASARGAEIDHVFRTPRWVLPMHVAGLHMTWLMFNRFGSVMMTGWGHPTAIERFLHRRLAFVVRAFWSMIAKIVRWELGRAAKDAAGRARIAAIMPAHALSIDLRSAAALAPADYFPRVASGAIRTHHAELASFDETGVMLANGEHVACDRVVLALGSDIPRFPFLPDAMREPLEREHDGVQLYRHLVHPAFPLVAFAGFNHGFAHVPAAEIGAEWIASLWRGELVLPPREEMEASVERIRAWKRAHIAFEPMRSCAINTRYQQYLDIVLRDLGVSPYRKLPNPIAEIFGRYGSPDYAGVHGELKRGVTRRPVPFDA